MSHNVRQSRLDAATHNCHHVIELVEDARPFMHIFVADYPSFVFFTLLAVGIMGLTTTPHENREVKLPVITLVTTTVSPVTVTSSKPNANQVKPVKHFQRRI